MMHGLTNFKRATCVTYRNPLKLWRLTLAYMVFINWISTSRKTMPLQYQERLLILFRKIIAVNIEDHKTYINTGCKKN